MTVTKINLTPEQIAILTTDLSEISGSVDLLAKWTKEAKRVHELECQLKNAERAMAGKNAMIAELETEVERLKKFITAAACKLDSNDATGGLYVLRCALAGESFLDEDQYYPPDDTPPSLDKYITDGFGIYWPEKCPNCGAPMQVIRPGDCRCSAECYTIDDRLSDKETEHDQG